VGSGCCALVTISRRVLVTPGRGGLVISGLTGRGDAVVDVVSVGCVFFKIPGGFLVGRVGLVFLLFVVGHGLPRRGVTVVVLCL